MTEHLHTPGPWEAELAIDDLGNETGKVWIIMNDQPCAYDFDRFEDALVAAAAPDLLSVVRDLFDNPEFQVAIGGNPIRVEELMQRARAAIAKALSTPENPND